VSKFNPTLSIIRSKIEKLMLMYKALEEELYRVTQENEDLKRQAGLLTSEALPTPNSIDVEAVQTIAQRLRSEIEALRQEIQPPKIEE